MSMMEQLNFLGERDPLVEAMIRASGGHTLQDVSQRIEQLDAKADSVKFLEAPTTKLIEQGTEPTEHETGPSPAALSKVGDYVLVRQIGRGGFGRVYAGYHKDRPDKLAAVKVYDCHWLDDIKRLEIEKLVLQKLNHPNLVTAIDWGEDSEGRNFLVMNLIDGVRVDRFVEEHKLGYQEIALLFRGIAEALEYAHGQDVVHRDLKPGNILITPDGVPIVTDFGLAKRLNLEGENSLTATGLLIGTLGYLAPEQADSKRREVTRLVDVYGLGATLYRVLAGVAPFQRENLLAALDELKTHSPVPPTKLVPGIPRDLEQICLKCLAKSPQDRYESMMHLADDLQRFVDGKQIAARPRSWNQRMVGWTVANPVIGGLSVGLIVAVLFGLVASTIFWRQAVGQQEITAELLAEAIAMSHSDDSAAERMLVQTPDTLEYRYQRLVDSVDFLEALLKRFPKNDELFRESATANFLLGKVCCKQAKWEEALVVYGTALFRFRELADAYPEDDTLQFDVFHSVLGLDHVDRALKFVPEMEEGRMAGAFELIQELVNLRPENADYLDALFCMKTLVYPRRYPAGSPKLIELYGATFDDAIRLKARFPSPSLHWRHVGGTAFKLATTHSLRGDLELSEEWLDIAFREFGEFLTRPDLDPGEYMDWTNCLRFAGELEQKKGNPEKAADYADQLKKYLGEKAAEYPDYHVFRNELQQLNKLAAEGV